VKNSDASESPGLYNNNPGLPDDVIADVVHKTISESGSKTGSWTNAI
jgi:hypothetical protein